MVSTEVGQFFDAFHFPHQTTPNETHSKDPQDLPAGQKINKSKWAIKKKKKKRVIEEAASLDDEEFEKRLESIIGAPRGEVDRRRAMLP